MSKLFKENGALSEEGERVFKEILDSKISVLLKQGETESEIRLIASLIHKRVGDAVADKLSAKKDLTSKFDKMTDEQFYAFLQAKYGQRWVLQSLTHEEFLRLPSAKCTGSWWNDEYGNSAFSHDPFTYCPVHDNK